jgi:hypothetical protein
MARIPLSFACIFAFGARLLWRLWNAQPAQAASRSADAPMAQAA